jgi:hypothetical protein
LLPLRRNHTPVFFVTPRHGPTTQLKKNAARELIICLRKQNYSVYEISEALKEQKRPSAPPLSAKSSKTKALPLPRRRDQKHPHSPIFVREKKRRRSCVLSVRFRFGFTDGLIFPSCWLRD